MHFLIPDNKIINKISFIILLLVVSCSSQKFTVSDHCDGERFFNTKKDLPKKNKGDYKKWREEQKLRPAWPETVVNTITPNIHSEIDSGKIAVTLINHATVLVQTKEVTFITDPIFSNTAGPLNIVGTKRVRAPSFEISQLPKIDLVLVSHNHYDHMDIRSMKKLRRKFDPLFVVPLGNKKFLKSKGFKNVIELDWWQEQTISDKIKVALAPALHWSKRKLRDNMKTLWGSFIVFSGTQKIYFAGDTGYDFHFKNIYDKYGAMDVSLLPTGAYEPRWFMKNFHMNPEESVRAHTELRSKFSFGYHWGTFRLTDEEYYAPQKDLKNALQKLLLPKTTFLTPDFGETIVFP